MEILDPDAGTEGSPSWSPGGEHPDTAAGQARAPDEESAGAPTVRQDGPADAVGPEVADDGQLDPLPADDQERPAEAQSADRSSAGRLWGYLAIYSLLRLALVAVLTAALMFFMPLIVALLFAIIVQLPLSWLLFSGPRRRVNDAIAQSSAQRRRERERLQSALSGDDFPA